MKKIIISFLLLSAIFGILFNQCSSGSYDYQETEHVFNQLIAISLKQAQNQLKQNDPEITAHIKKFCGMTEIIGFMKDDANNDLILFGDIDTSKNNLYFDDFVISLKSVYKLYGQYINDTFRYSLASCSIDPMDETMERLDRLNESSGTASHTSQYWESICGEPQQVSVFGAPHNSHLSWVIVEADYLMKDIVNGRMKPKLDYEFKSLSDLRKDEVLSNKKAGKETDLGSAMNRFEFTSDMGMFEASDENDYFHLISVPVKLVTEEEYLMEKSYQSAGESRVVGTGDPNPMALEFTRYFNMAFRDLASQIPVFYDLQQTYNLFATAQAILENDIVEDSFFEYLLNDYTVDSFPVRYSVPGKSCIDSVRMENSTEYLYSCGGVNLKSSIKVASLRRGALYDFRQNILSTRRSQSDYMWTIQMKEQKIFTYYINRFPIHMY